MGTESVGELLLALRGRTGEPLPSLRATPPLSVAALAIGDRLLVANLLPVEQEVSVQSFPGGAFVHRLGPYETLFDESAAPG